MVHFKELYPNVANKLKLYIGDSTQENFDKEMFMNIALENVSIREFTGMQNELLTIIRDYAKLGKRNENAMSHNKLSKHMMHLVRLYYMCFDILEKVEINTYRDKEHNLLMSIRDGAYLDSNDKPVPSFYEMVHELEARLQYDKNNTDLPEKVNKEKIYDLKMQVNEAVIKGEF